MSESRRIVNKRILVLANFDIGLYKFRRALLEELLRGENEVFISLPRGDLVPELEKIGCRYIETTLDRRGMNPVRDISLYRKYCRILKEIQPDLVISYTIKPNIYGGLACRMAKIPFAANITGLGSAIEGGGILQKLVFTMYKAGLAKAKVVFFENEGNREVLVNAGVVKKEKTQVLKGAGIDTDEYPLLQYPPEKPVHFLFVGRIMKEKGVDELFCAMMRLKKEYGDDVILDVVGMFEESYQQKIERLQNDGIIVFHGYQQDVKPFYEMAHCVVLPSYHEGMSNVLLEAASSGRPLITSRIHGCMEAVEENISGFLCEPGNTESLYEAMKRFCLLSHEERIAFGLAGRERMEAVYRKEIVIKQTINKLDEI
ncbi:MAG: glycosyltransferase family 4 protein [Clostridia bacterium]|nr:glycosyltransferase family 4 protein [Clostridia bacterium]